MLLLLDVLQADNTLPAEQRRNYKNVVDAMVRGVEAGLQLRYAAEAGRHHAAGQPLGSMHE